MSDLYWLTDEQMARLAPFFPKSHGKPRVDDRRVLSGIIFVNRNGLRWRDAPAAYGPHKTLYNRWKRWSEAGVFIRMMEGLSGAQTERRTVMIDATYLKAHRTASSLRGKKGGLGRLIGRTKGGMNTKLHAVTDANGRPISLFMTAGQVSDYIGAAALLDSLPRAQWLLGDRGYDADWFRDALQAKGITPCIPGRKTRTEPIRYDKRRYKRRNRIEIMFGRLKDWRRVATRYDRCPNVFLSAIALAATVLFWL
ncbi:MULTISPECIES: IS5 family transposase [unclassified Agrobacterium]|uniref:IS5 family transposase n=1 Tax=unclassified Agrobacterium TaxID=2632611 RepID=UPI00244B530C|nr:MULTISPECIES: IS5 family transposase [unclassified Agrobacterium]MDH0612678.1 IS5 family transposase [Agrobacterium sp. GD03872]MDH0699749.1 IS5 family transposase [Agrobacterium sp. GD03871]MDH1062625.1 IS5 family transposase [Agrobacterium sp. GD03992]MDH2209349.1 IS5 family transposase [Agrobacterium sp. GD03643]MDH2223021.1 IS5 family transposase [Agrobacterium sp. GD03642]